MSESIQRTELAYFEIFLFYSSNLINYNNLPNDTQKPITRAVTLSMREDRAHILLHILLLVSELIRLEKLFSKNPLQAENRPTEVSMLLMLHSNYVLVSTSTTLLE